MAAGHPAGGHSGGMMMRDPGAISMADDSSRMLRGPTADSDPVETREWLEALEAVQEIPPWEA